MTNFFHACSGGNWYNSDIVWMTWSHRSKILRARTRMELDNKAKVQHGSEPEKCWKSWSCRCWGGNNNLRMPYPGWLLILPRARRGPPPATGRSDTIRGYSFGCLVAACFCITCLVVFPIIIVFIVVSLSKWWGESIYIYCISVSYVVASLFGHLARIEEKLIFFKKICT